MAVGVDVACREHTLGIPSRRRPGHPVLSQLHNRGLRGIPIAGCDGLSGRPEAITPALLDTVVRTCVVQVIRNAMRFASCGDRKETAVAMRSVEAARSALDDLARGWVHRYPGLIDVRHRA